MKTYMANPDKIERKWYVVDAEAVSYTHLDVYKRQILRYAEEADSRYYERLDLVHADMCIAQDAFPETENGGYCLRTEIAFYLMYKAISKICAEIDCEKERGEKWRHRSENMLRSINCLLYTSRCV